MHGHKLSLATHVCLRGLPQDAVGMTSLQPAQRRIQHAQAVARRWSILGATRHDSAQLSAVKLVMEMQISMEQFDSACPKVTVEKSYPTAGRSKGQCPQSGVFF